MWITSGKSTSDGPHCPSDKRSHSRFFPFSSSWFFVRFLFSDLLEFPPREEWDDGLSSRSSSPLCLSEGRVESCDVDLIVNTIGTYWPTVYRRYLLFDVQVVLDFCLLKTLIYVFFIWHIPNISFRIISNWKKIEVYWTHNSTYHYFWWIFRYILYGNLLLCIEINLNRWKNEKFEDCLYT